MRFLADENIEQAVVDALRAAGHDVLFITETNPGLPDGEVLRQAEADNRILLTNDKDFGELVFRLHRLATGIVLLRFETELADEKAVRLKGVLPTIEPRLVGHFAVVSEAGVRLRHLESVSRPDQFGHQ